MTFLKTVVAAAALVFTGAGAQSATFDFDAMGNAFEASYADFAANGAVNGMLTNGGVSITNMTATGDAGEYAYLDGGNYAGLGACAEVDCAGNSDDNLTFPETVTVMFDRIVTAFEVLLNGNHAAFGDGWIDINGGTYAVTGGVADLTGLAASNAYTFSNPVNQSGEGAYISSMTVIPLPAAGFLLLGGLGGLMALGRRKAA